jgi:hypothetical protein
MMMMIRMMLVGVVGVVLLEGGGGMVPITAPPLQKRGSVMYVATWNKPHTYIPDILTENLQFMATMSTCQLDRKTSLSGLSTVVRIWPLIWSILAAPQMSANGGPAQRRPV